MIDISKCKCNKQKDKIKFISIIIFLLFFSSCDLVNNYVTFNYYKKFNIRSNKALEQIKIKTNFIKYQMEINEMNVNKIKQDLFILEEINETN